MMPAVNTNLQSDPIRPQSPSPLNDHLPRVPGSAVFNFSSSTWAGPITGQLTETGADTREELFGNSLRLLLGLQSGDFEVVRREAEVELGV